MKLASRLLSALMALCLLVCGIETKANAESIEQRVTEDLYRALAGYEVQVDVGTGYVSKEYLEELEFNTRETCWFGYYLSDVEAMMGDKKWVFTTGEDGTTQVMEFQPNDNKYKKVLERVAIGTGVVLICVTISIVSGGVGAPVVSAVFAASAKTATIYGLSAGAISGVVAGVKTAIETDGDYEAALKAAADVGSEAYMWGTITGAAVGGVKATAKVIAGNTAKVVPQNQEALAQAAVKATQEDGCIKAMRSAGVKRAWREEALRAQAGTSLYSWTAGEKKQLLTFGKVAGYEGHHVITVKNALATNNKSLITSPDNIVFLSKLNHRLVHSGKFQNPTDIGVLKNLLPEVCQVQLPKLGIAY